MQGTINQIGQNVSLNVGAFMQDYTKSRIPQARHNIFTALRTANLS